MFDLRELVLTIVATGAGGRELRGRKRDDDRADYRDESPLAPLTRPTPAPVGP
jgi:hypothetical protein